MKLFLLFFIYSSNSFAFQYEWKQTSLSSGICYLKGLDQNLIEYSNRTKDDNCFSSKKFIWKNISPTRGQCLRIEGNKTLEVFYTACKKNIKIISKWEVINKVGFCFSVDFETQGNKYKIKTNSESCFPKRKTYIVKSDSMGKGLCYMIDKEKEKESNFEFQVPFIFCKNKIMNHIGRAPAIIPSDIIEDSSREIKKKIKHIPVKKTHFDITPHKATSSLNNEENI